MSATSEQKPVIIVKPPSGWELIDFKELIEYRDLFVFLVWRDIKVLYAQTIMGLSWAILNPVIQIIIFTLIFGKVANIPTDGIPYFLFSTVAVIPWTYMSNAMTASSQSLVTGQATLGKVYFPRLIFPIAPVLAKLLDFVISLIVVVIVMLYYKVVPTWNLVYFPLFFLFMVMIPIAIGFWLSALAIRYRDVKFVMQFCIRMLMYTAPIVYSASSIPEGYRLLYSLNPIVGVIEGMRSCILGTNFQWEFILPGMFTATVLLIGGAFYFRKMERVFVDVI